MLSLADAPGCTAEFRFRVPGYETDDLRVTAFEGSEGLSELFDFCIRLCSENDSIELQSMLGRPAVLELDGEHGTRFVNGVIRRFERIGESANLTHYEARVVPPHWLLTRRIQSRVFNSTRCPQMDVIGIVSKVLGDAGLGAAELTLATSRDYEAREFAVQYRESDWDFISRILEEEGIYYFFAHAADRCRLVLIDSKDLHEPFDKRGSEIPYRDPNGLVEEHEFIFNARRGAEVHIGAVSLDDFNFRQPGGELRASAGGPQFNSLIWADYPGEHRDSDRGRRLATTRLEEQQVHRHSLSMMATVRGFCPGSRFSLIEHPDAAFNGEYLITSMTHRASQAQSGEEEASPEAGTRFDVEIRAIPVSVQFRPPRCTPRPIIPGSQTAIVVGPPGEEIHTDEYGRIEVRFHWDPEGLHDAGASCWIRVSQGWAGGQYGTLFLPRVGQEVIVDFLEGNPDQPIITGRVYNRDHMPPYKLPEQRTISTIRTCSSPGGKGGNEVRFDDAKGAEQLLLFAQNSMHLRSRGSRFENVGGQQHRIVAKGAYELVKESKHSTVKLDRLEETQGNVHMRIDKDVKERVTGRKTTYVGKKYAILNGDGVVLESDTAITLKVKGNFIKIDATGVTIMGTMVKINSGGTADNWEWDSPDALTLPEDAATTEFGHNCTYSATPDTPDALQLQAGPRIPEDDSLETLTSWIEIELVDDLGRPCPDEEYEVREPDGAFHRGRLDAKGHARVLVRSPGQCSITFPRLDSAAWEKN